MADITVATRAVILAKIKSMVNQLEAINDSAAQLQTSLVGLGDADAADTINKLLTGGGLATTTDGTGDTLSDEIVGVLYGNVTVSVNGTATALSWTHTP
jgi:hypothetical protein